MNVLRPRRTRLAVPAILAALATPSLQAAMPDRDAEISVVSNPPGAMVRIMGKNWGETPVRLKLKQAFPSLYRPEQPYVGMALYLRKDGCDEYRYPLHRRNIPDEISVNLNCEPAVTAQEPAPAPVLVAPVAESPAAPTATPSQATSPVSAQPAPAKPKTRIEFSSVRKKLEELEQLRKDGLVTEQEYQKLRKRVLSYF